MNDKEKQQLVKQANEKGYTARINQNGDVEYIAQNKQWHPYPPDDIRGGKNYPQGAASLSYNIELRDIFAGQAMNGFLAGQKPGSVYDVTDLAMFSYAVADAMLFERPERERIKQETIKNATKES